MYSEEQIENWFKWHSFSEEDVELSTSIRNKAKEIALLVNSLGSPNQILLLIHELTDLVLKSPPSRERTYSIVEIHALMSDILAYQGYSWEEEGGDINFNTNAFCWHLRKACMFANNGIGCNKSKG